MATRPNTNPTYKPNDTSVAPQTYGTVYGAAVKLSRRPDQVVRVGTQNYELGRMSDGSPYALSVLTGKTYVFDMSRLLAQAISAGAIDTP